MFVDLMKGIILRFCYSEMFDLKAMKMDSFNWKLCFYTDLVNISKMVSSTIS